MFKLFDKDKTKENTKDDLIIKVTSLLIHVAKIDENYTNKEKEIIKRTLIELGVDDKSLENILKKATEIEKNSNQILEFTREVKNKDELFKVKLIEALWKIIYADGVADMYESSLMRRLTGLLYLDNKLVGDIKNKIKNNFSK
tara:strand:- start:116 stop:544 length:429 start_codon:yes stop_codon:yes gene_type:complete